MPPQLTFSYGKVLTLCITARNQMLCVKQQLQRLALLEPAVLERIEILIVDNDSSDGTSTAVHQFEGRVPHHYISNTENLSHDNSFTFALNQAIQMKSKYIWLLNAQNVVRVEHFESFIDLLEKNEMGLVHLAPRDKARKPSAQYIDADDFLQDVGMGIIDVSRNILRTDYIRGYNQRDFGAGTGIPAVPLFLHVALSAKQNCTYYLHLFTDAHVDLIAEVNDPIRSYVKNLIAVYTRYEDTEHVNSISPATIMRLKTHVSDFMLPIIARLFILRKGTKNVDPKSSRATVKQNLGWRPLLSTVKRCFSPRLWGRVLRTIWLIVRKLLTLIVAGLTMLICNTLVTRAWTHFRNSLTTYRFRYRVKVGRRCSVEGPVITEGKNITIGANFRAKGGLHLQTINTGNYTPKITIGDDVSLERRVRISSIREVRIGNNVQIGPDVLITDHQYGKTDGETLRIPPADRQLTSRGHVVIEADVLIGPNVTILAGVTIGKGAVIGANAVVTRSVPPLSVAVGVPARVKGRQSPLSLL